MAARPIDWTWCLDLPQRFDSLLGIAEELTTAQWRPAEDDEIGGLAVNLYLVTCALLQVLHDHLHRPLLDQGLGAVWFSARLKSRERELQLLARSLAVSVLAGDSTPGREDIKSVVRLRATRWPATLRHCRLRVPRSLRVSGMYPQDCRLLADRACSARADAAGPVLVVGVSTSSWYLNPLFAAALEELGHADVRVIVLRGDELPPSRAADAVRELVARGGWAMVIGDPGGGGVGFVRAISTLTELGLPESRITVANCGLADALHLTVRGAGDREDSAAEPEPLLRGFEQVRHVALTPEERYVHRMLSDEAVERWLNRAHVLQRLDADAAVITGGTWVPNSQPHMWHRLLEVELQRGGMPSQVFVLGRSVGLGFFGYHAWLTAVCMRDRVPEAIGIYRGVLFLRWEASQELSGPIQPADLDEIATYVAARARRLTLRRRHDSKREARPTDKTTNQVARLVSQPRIGKRTPARVAEQIGSIQPPTHSVVDGRMDPSEWVRLARGGLLKRESAARNPDVTDPVHDLAATVIGFRLDADEERHLVAAYQRLSGDFKDLAARLAVHKLQLGWSELAEVPSLGFDLGTKAGRVSFARELVIRETLLTRTVNGYLAGLYLTNTTRDMSGQVLALNIDNSFETNRLGFEATSPAGVQALQLLLTHGRGVVGYSDNSLGELRERCHTFGLLGGVAEHGSVIWDEQRKEALSMIGEETRLTVARLRDALLDETDLLIDPRHQYSLRLFRHTDEGRRAADADFIRAVMARHAITGLRLIHDRRWTMVCDAGARTAGALERWRSTKGAPGFLGQVLVVGDDLEDIGVMSNVDGSRAPESVGADLRVRAAKLPMWHVHRPYQAGTLQIVRKVVHHRRRACGMCRLFPMPCLEGGDAVLVTALGLQDRSPLLPIRLHPRVGAWGRGSSGTTTDRRSS